MSDMASSAKEYGKLTASQFSELIGYVPLILGMIQELGDLLSQTPASRFDEVMKTGYGNYSHIYETPFSHHLAMVTVALNRQGDIHEWAVSSDPQEAVLDAFRKRDQIEDDRPLHEAFDEPTALALIYSVGRTIASMATYGRSISALLQDVRERSDIDALFKAIRMDRCVVGCPSAMQVIARAQMRDNKAFFRRLRAALAGPSKKEWAGLHPMRYALILLNEMGVHDLSEAKLETLMVDQLKVYPRSPSARKNLLAHYQRSRKLKTI